MTFAGNVVTLLWNSLPLLNWTDARRFQALIAQTLMYSAVRELLNSRVIAHYLHNNLTAENRKASCMTEKR